MLAKGRTAIEGLARDERDGRPLPGWAVITFMIDRKERLVWLSTIASVFSEKSPVSSLSTVDLPSFVLNANCSRDMRSRAI